MIGQTQALHHKQPVYIGRGKRSSHSIKPKKIKDEDVKAVLEGPNPPTPGEWPYPEIQKTPNGWRIYGGDVRDYKGSRRPPVVTTEIWAAMTTEKTRKQAIHDWETLIEACGHPAPLIAPAKEDEAPATAATSRATSVPAAP